MADAALGNKGDAIREGRRATELMPVSKNAIMGPLLIEYLAVIYAWTGEKDRADRKSTRLNSSHRCISYAVFCLKKKIKDQQLRTVIWCIDWYELVLSIYSIQLNILI